MTTAPAASESTQTVNHQRPLKKTNKTGSKIIALSSLQETAFLSYSNHRRASNPTKESKNMTPYVFTKKNTAKVEGGNSEPVLWKIEITENKDGVEVVEVMPEIYNSHAEASAKCRSMADCGFLRVRPVSAKHNPTGVRK